MLLFDIFNIICIYEMRREKKEEKNIDFTVGL